MTNKKQKSIRFGSARRRTRKNPKGRYGSTQFNSRGQLARSRWAIRRATPLVQSSAYKAKGRKALQKMRRIPQREQLKGLSPRERLRGGRPLKNPARSSRLLFVQVEQKDGSYVSMAHMLDTKENRVIAKRLALTYSKIPANRGRRVRVITE